MNRKMNKEKSLIFLSTIQVDLISQRKRIRSEITKLEKKYNRIMSSAESCCDKLSHNTLVEKNSLKKSIQNLRKDEMKIQLQIEAIMFVCKFMKEN